MKGLFMVDRSMLSHHIVGIKNPKRFIMWIWLVRAAGYRDRKWWAGGEEIHLMRGQLFVSVREFAKETGVSRSVAERFLTILRDSGSIETEARTDGSVITICNYERYQDFQIYNGTVSETQTSQKAGQEQAITEPVAGHKRKKVTQRTQVNTSSSSSSGPVQDVFDRELFEDLMEAIGAAAIDGAKGLTDLEYPKRWLFLGCNRRQDILPVVIKIANRQIHGGHQKTISTWSYFNSAVLEARDVRQMPTSEEEHGQGNQSASRGSPEAGEARAERAAYLHKTRDSGN